MFILLAYILGILVGMILGLIGGGGVFLFPINHFLLGQDVASASAHAACLVCIAATMGAIPRIRRGEVDWPTVFALGIPVSAGMLLVRLWLLSVIPEVLCTIGDYDVTRKTVVLVPFAMLLVLSFASMKGLIAKDLKPRLKMRTENPTRYYSILIVVGLLIGIVPGFAGAGGGVLIVPILVVLFGLPMKTVVGTSLTIVAAKSAIGFLGGDLVSIPDKIDFQFLAQFSVVMVAGSLIGSKLAHRIDGQRLKNAFAWLVLALAIYIFVKETIFVA